jgi:hypothetical protein
MGNTRNTGYLQNIVVYDANDNITLPARLAVTGTVSVNNTTPYDTTQFSLDVNGGLIVKNINKTAQFVLINSNPASGGNNAFVVHTVGGTSASSYADIQGYYGTSITGSTVLRLNPQGGNVLVGSLAGTGSRMVVASSTGVLSTQAIVTLGDLSGVSTARTLTINGTTQDLSANRTWTLYTDDISEDGSPVNLWFTNARARAAISVTGSGSYDSATGVITVTGGVTAVNTKTGDVTLTTSDITEGTRLYYTDTRVGTYLTSNSYATQSYVTTQIANLVDSAPGTLDTLNELAAALGDDPNFATSVATSIGTKQAQLNGTGFVKISGTTISYDNSTYLTSFTETDPIYVASSWYSTTNNASNWNTAYGWGNHASGGYLTTSSAASTYASLTGAYANPSWITSLAYSKITGVPAFLTSYTETDTLATVTGRGNTTTDRINVRGIGNQSGGNILMGNLGVNTNKWSYLIGTHYNTTTQPQGVSIIGLYSDLNNNTIVIGGSIYEANPATEIQFWTHNATSHNLGGTKKMTLNSDGNLSITGTVSASNFSGTHSGSSSGTNTGDQTNITGNAGTATLAANSTLWNGLSTPSGFTSTGTVDKLAGGLTGFGDIVWLSQARVQSFLGLGSLAYSSATIPTNTNQLTNGAGYITSYTETDTLASVTGRGASTSTALTLSGGSGTTPTIALDRNIATPSNYYSGLQLEIRATSGTAGIGLHRNGFSHVGIYHDAQDTIKFNMNSGTVTINHNTGTVWGSGNLTNLNQLTNGPGYITGNQTITLSGDVSGSGTTSISVTIGASRVTNAMLANSSFNIGTTSISLGRSSAVQSLTGVRISGIDNTYGNALVQSGAGRTDDANGDTWIFADSLGSDSNKWGIRHDQVSNRIDFWGNNTKNSYIQLNTGVYFGDVSGNASTATNVAWTGVTGRPTALSSFTNDLGNYGGWITGVTNISGYSGSVNIPDWRNTSYTPAQYDGNRVNWHFNNTNYNDSPPGDFWGAMQTVSPWSEFNVSHRQSQLWWGGSVGLSYRYALGSGYTPTGWSSWERIITSATISSQPVVTIQDGPPSGTAGRLWWESDTGKLKVYYGSAWVDASPIPDSSLFFAKAGGVITGDVSIGQTLNVVGNTLVQGNINAFGDITAYSSSDSRLKDNITIIESPLEKLSKINGVSFNWNDKQSVYEVGAKDYGVIAQEVEEVLPELVTTRDNGYKAVRYEKIVSLLIEAIKEQQTQINNLTDKLNKL